jgi:hypothetical protein
MPWPKAGNAEKKPANKEQAAKLKILSLIQYSSEGLKHTEDVPVLT